MDEIVSFVSGLALMTVAVFVMRAYWPAPRKDRATWYLALAIFLGFFAAAANTFYWQIIFKLAQWVNADLGAFRDFGNYMDLAFKGGGALAGYLHLKAMWERLPKKERSEWSPMEMPWYPRRRLCVSLLSRTVRRK